MYLRSAMVVLSGASLFIADAASAQWLNPTLDAQRADNLRRHQQRLAEKNAQKKRTPPDIVSERPLTRAERKAAWAVHEPEYRRRIARDGYPSADRWFEAQAWAMVKDASTKR